MPNRNFIFLMTCPDRPGIVADVTKFISENGGFITHSQHYGDAESKNFFMRTVFDSIKEELSLEEIKKHFQPIAEKYSMEWNFYDPETKPNILIAVSKFGHCLNDLLHKSQTKQIPINICGVVSNHPTMEKMTKWYDIPYYHLPVDPDNKPKQEQQIKDLVNNLNIDLVVLARYMQILSPDMTKFLHGRCINVHHSFLPSFKGAAPYKQAHNKGVKIIGATAHYVTSDLDEGPIIEQTVERVDHTYNLENFVNTGRDLENIVLSRAVKWHAEHRILINGHKTVVFK